jgi:Rrf2 family protein
VQLGEGVEWALHCCVVLALVPPDRTLPATRLAEVHALPPAYLAKHLQALSGAGIVTSVPGRRGGYRLARPPSAITVLEVVEALEGDGSAFRCTEIRRRGPAAVPAREYSPVCGIAAVMDRADKAWRAELASQTLADVVTGTLASISPRAVEKGARWLGDVLDGSA